MSRNIGNKLHSSCVMLFILLFITSCSSSEFSPKGATTMISGTGANKMTPKIDEVFPKGKEVPADEKIRIVFNMKMAKGAQKNITITINGAKGVPLDSKYETVKGKWEVEDDKVFIFTPDKNLTPGNLICIDASEGIKSEDGQNLDISTANRFFYIVDDNVRLGLKDIRIPVMKKENDGLHNIPMHITLPKEGGPFPVMFWVHGGGWNGGTPADSVVGAGNQSEYLAEHLGVAIVSVAYRCKGSNGNFSDAMIDVMDAVQYVREHAKEYNIDAERMGFYGGSAGTPLAALAAQRTPEAVCFIGYNGIYNFVENPGSTFVDTSQYGLQEPSARANSAIYNLKEAPPATLLLHGTNDPTINPQQSVLFAQAVVNAGGIAKVCLYEGEKHAFFNVGRLMELPTLYEVKEFIRKSFK